MSTVLGKQKVFECRIQFRCRYIVYQLFKFVANNLKIKYLSH